MLLRKLHPKAYGPFPVVHISYLPGTCDPVGIIVNLGTAERPNHKRFARGRVHPFSYVHRDINWRAIASRARECREGPQEFIDEFDRAIDLTSITQGGNRRMAIDDSVDVEDVMSTSGPLINYISQEGSGRLYEPQRRRHGPQSYEEMID